MPVDPGTAYLISELGGAGLEALFGGDKEDDISKNARWYEGKIIQEKRYQAANLTKYLRETFGDRVAMQMLERMGMDFDLGQKKEQWGMSKDIYGKAGGMFDAPAFDPTQNISNVERSIEPSMKRLQSSFAKRGMSGGGPEWSGLAHLQSGALSDYLTRANERSYQWDKENKYRSLGLQQAALR